MGNYYSTSQTWYVYSRDLTSESWNKEPIHQAEEEILGIFKHLIYKFALQMDDANKNYKAIYLYQGSTRYIKAAKIEITATEELVLNGQTVKIQAQGDIEMAAASVTTAQVNKKEIVIGQSMKFGAGEDTDLQFDPRASKNIISPGNVNHKVLGDYKIKSLRKMSVNAVTGLFMSSPATTTVQGLASMVVNGPGGMNLKSGKTTFETGDFTVTSGKTDFNTADFDINSAKIDMTATGQDVTITGSNVRLFGSKIYLN